MKTDSPVAAQKAVVRSSQTARSLSTFRLQVALDEAARQARAGRIRQLREESPYTQPHIADHVGVSLRAYQRWEEGGGIEWEHLEKLAELHEVDPQWIHRGEEKGETPELSERLSALETKVDRMLDWMDAQTREALEADEDASLRRADPSAQRSSKRQRAAESQ